jgi:hypothetical protein
MGDKSADHFREYYQYQPTNPENGKYTNTTLPVLLLDYLWYIPLREICVLYMRPGVFHIHLNNYLLWLSVQCT